MENSVLFVDDERPILRALQRLFMDKPYDVFLAESGQEALNILKEHKIDIIVSDMRMPQMNGHALLRQVKADYPETIRIILSGYAQEMEIVKALLDGSARMYLVKPWSNETFVATLDNIFRLRKHLQNAQLLSVINKTEELPSLPVIYNRICKLIEQDASLKEIAGEIEHDQSLASRVLQVVNSAFVGVKTGSIQQACSYLGVNVLKDVVLSVKVLDMIRDAKNSGYYEVFWQHTNLTNKIFKILSAKTLKTKAVPDQGASAGLLHDIGKVALIANGLISPQQLLVDDSCAAEMVSFDITHEDIGGYLLDWWQLPYPIIEAALFHHTPLQTCIVHRELVGLVHVADHYSWMMLKHCPAPLVTEVFDIIQITQAECEALIEKIEN